MFLFLTLLIMKYFWYTLWQ